MVITGQICRKASYMWRWTDAREMTNTMSKSAQNPKQTNKPDSPDKTRQPWQCNSHKYGYQLPSHSPFSSLNNNRPTVALIVRGNTDQCKSLISHSLDSGLSLCESYTERRLIRKDARPVYDGTHGMTVCLWQRLSKVVLLEKDVNSLSSGIYTSIMVTILFGCLDTGH